MKYKSISIDYLTNDIKVSNLCFYNEHYYFESDSIIEEAEIATDEEFEQALSSIVSYDEEPESEDGVTWDSMAAAINEGVNEV